MPQPVNMLDRIADDLSTWIDDIAEQLADAMMGGSAAPFAAQLTEQQKLDYYTRQLFNPDGTPNMQGRAVQMQRLGPQEFAMVFKAVVKAHPDLAIPTPPPGAAIPPPLAGQGAGPPAPALPGLPPSLGIPRMGGGLPLGDVGAPGPATGSGPLG
jgi:hypothetical protein